MTSVSATTVIPEAQHIVALSLGKIAASRNTRSGLRLHKSLMVSTVLYRARTAVIMEKYHSRGESSTTSSTSSEEDVDEENDTTDLESTEQFEDDCEQGGDKPEQTTDIDAYEDEEYDASSEYFEEEGAESEPAQVVPQMNTAEPLEATDVLEKETSNSESSSCDNPKVSGIPDSSLTETDSEKENDLDTTKDISVNPSCVIESSKLEEEFYNNNCQFASSPKSVLRSCENTTQNLDSQVIAKCERCTKRRLTEVESAVESITPPSCKRLKYDTADLNTSSDKDEENVLDTSRFEVSMDGVQITNLVDSFSGLLSTENGTIVTENNSANSAVSDTLTSVIGVTDSLNSVIEQCGIQYKTNKSTVNNTVSKGHGLSEGFNHCSTQIKESFEALALPISLSV